MSPRRLLVWGLKPKVSKLSNQVFLIPRTAYPRNAESQPAQGYPHGPESSLHLCSPSSAPPPHPTGHAKLTCFQNNEDLTIEGDLPEKGGRPILPLYHLLYSALKWSFGKPGQPKVGCRSSRAFGCLLYLCSFFLSTTIISSYSPVFQKHLRWIQTLLSHIYHNVCPAVLFRVSNFPLLW